MKRTLLVPFPVLAAWLGTAYILGNPRRTSSAAFDTARAIEPISTWGWLFLIGAAALTAALVFDSRATMTIALTIGGGIYTWWAGCFAYSALTDSAASATGPGIHGFIAAVHFTAAWIVWVRIR